ncbi:hypothetical protein [Streptomyces luteogriseus]
MLFASAARLRLELRVNGPLPPYSFVDTLGQHADSTAEAFEAAVDHPTNG